MSAKTLTVIEFTAYGEPRTQGNKQAYVNTDRQGNPYRRPNGSIAVKIVEKSDDKLKVWRSVVADACREVYRGALLTGPLHVSMTFVFVRPKAHYRTGRNAHLLKDDAPPRPVKKDVTKLVRCAEDALTKVLWVDDKQVAVQVNEKVWGDRWCAIIRVRELGDVSGENEWKVE